MHETEERPPEGEQVLGRLGGGPYDTELGPSAERIPPVSHRRPPADGAPAADAIPAPPPDTGPLTLPRGGLVALRQSGGLNFTTRELIVFRDSRTHYRCVGKGFGPVESQGKLTLAELAQLHALLDQADFSAQPPPTARHNPDSYAYELVARVRRRKRAVEVFEGSVPGDLAPLILRLRHLMPPDS
jgi:hypothetical protein